MSVRYRKILFLGIFSVLAAVCLIFSLPIGGVAEASEVVPWDGSVSSSLLGSGDIDDPYIISNGSDLKFLADQVNGGNSYGGKYFSVNATEIDLGGKPISIGYLLVDDGDVENVPFGGTFNGNGVVIKNLSLSVEEEYGQPIELGLFGNISAGGSVNSVLLSTVFYTVNENVDPTVEVTYSIGGIAGYLEGTVSRCAVNGLTYDGVYNGCGIAGTVAVGGLVSSCTVNGINATDGTVVGIAGSNEGEITDCLVEGDISCNNCDLIGLVGSNESAGVVTRSAFKPLAVTGVESFVGLVAGNGGAVTLSYAYADIVATGGISGLFGNNVGTFSECAYFGDMHGDTVSILGAVNSGTATDLTMVGNVEATTIDLFVRGGCDGLTGAFVSAYLDGAVAHTQGTGTKLFYDGSHVGKDIEGATPYYLGVNIASEIGAKWSTPINNGVPVVSTLYEVANQYYTAVNGDYIQVTLDEDTFYIKKGTYLALPEIVKTGYNHLGYSDGTATYQNKVTVNATATYLPVFSLTDITYVGSDGNVSKTYDGLSATIGAEFRYELALTYSWEYSVDGSSYTAVAGDTDTYEVTDVADSGFYKCVASFSDGNDTRTTRSEAIEVSIMKAYYTDITATPIAGGKYSGKQLGEFSLPTSYRWQDATTVPTVDVTEYPALYNADSDNYYDYALLVGLTLEKGDYADITYDYGDSTAVYGGKYSGQELSAVVLERNFRWADDSTVMSVGTHEYPALYNADSVNYNDYPLNVKLELDKGVFEGITHPQFNRVYSPTATLADYTLEEYFVWADDTVTPTVAVKSYPAIYNSDSSLYEDFALDITIVVSQAESTVNPVLSTDTVYVGGAFPTISLSAGDTAGDIEFISDILVLGTNEYTYLFTPYSGNYTSRYGKVSFSVVEKTLISLRVNKLPNKVTYKPFEAFEREGMEVVATYNGNKEESVFIYLVEYPAGRDHLLYGDTFVTLKYTYDEVTKTAEVPISVEKITVNRPVDDNEYRYSGESMTTSLVNTPLYTIQCDSRIEAGSYHFTATLIDGNNYAWADTADISVQVAWTILPLEVSAPRITGTFVYDGTKQYCGIALNDLYEITNGDGQTDAGTYTVSISLLDKDNTKWYGKTGEAGTADLNLNWVIERKQVEDPTMNTEKYLFDGTYLNFDYRIDEGYRPNVTGGLDAGEYTVVFSLVSDNYEWRMMSLSDTRELTFTISPMPMTLPSVETTFVYDGSLKSVLPEDRVGIVPGGKITAKDAGEYVLELTLLNANYEWWDGTNGEKTIEWSIDRAEVTKPTVGTNPIYAGRDLPAPIAVDPLYTMTNGSGKNAGSYLSTVTLRDVVNYRWSDGTDTPIDLEWAIEQKKVALPTVGGTYVYTGEPLTATVSTTECVVSGNVATEVDIYTMTVSLIDDNYKWMDDTTASKLVEWRISPYLVTKPTVLMECTYTGSDQYAPISSSAYYTVSGNVGKNAGSYTAKVTLTDKRNFAWADNTANDLDLNWVINKRTVTIPTVSGNLIYNGEIQKPKITASPYYTVSGEGKEAGSYTATVTLVDPANDAWAEGDGPSVSVAFHIYKVQFALDAGDTDVKYEAGATLPVPTKDGYNFDGWYLNSDFSGNKVTSFDSLDGNVKLYPKFLPDGIDAPPSAGKADGNGLSTMAIIGIVVAAVCALIAIAIIVVVIVNKKPKLKI